MATNVIVQTRVAPDLKQDADSLFSQLGISTADAIRLFLQQAVNDRGLPFQPRLRQPNKETIAAIMDARQGKTERFDSIADLMDDLNADD